MIWTGLSILLLLALAWLLLPLAHLCVNDPTNVSGLPFDGS